jgi:hypothetical protein
MWYKCGVARPRASAPQLAVWIDKAGSPEKRHLAEAALSRGFAPVTLAKRVGMDQRELGRWFRRAGNGNGQILQEVVHALNSRLWEVRAQVAPDNLSVDDLRRIQGALLEDVRTNLEGYREPREFAKKVKTKLESCRPETRRTVLAQYTRDRMNQTADLEAAWRDATIPVPTTRHHAASEAAVQRLGVLADLPVPPRPPRQPQELAQELFMFAQQLRGFVYAGKQAFSEDDVAKSVSAVLKTLAQKGWPTSVLGAARQHYDQHFSEGL